MAKKHGFTILELTITVGMMTILIGAIMSVYLTCFRAYNSGADRSKVRTQLSQAIDQMTKDLQKAQYITVCTSTASSTATLTFYANLGSGANTYSYSYSNTTEQLTGPFGTVKAVDIVPQGTVVNWGTTPALFSCGNGVVTIDMTAVGNAKTISSTVRGDTVHIQTYVRTRNIPVGIVGWFRFDDVTTATGNCTSTVSDSSGNGYSGTCSGSPSWTTGNVSGIGALSFNGTSGNVNASSFSFSGTSITVSLWIKANPSWASIEKYPYLLTIGNNQEFAILLDGVSGSILYPLMWTQPDESGGNVAATSSNVGDGNWHHIVAVDTGGTGSFYVDGVLAASNSMSLVSASNLNIGSYFNSNHYFPGSIDDVRIYNRALSASEIAQVYNGE